MTWQPIGTNVLVKLGRSGSLLALDGSPESYTGTGEVIAIGPKVEGIQVGDTVIVPRNVLGHEELGKDVALVDSEALIARRPASAH